MRYYNNYRDRFLSSSPMARFIIIAAMIFGAVLIAPRVLPYVATGLSCEQMPTSNLDPYNQSVLRATLSATTNYDPLRLELVADSANLTVGQSLVLTVRFINESMGPVQLFLVPESIIFRYNTEENGLLIFMQNIQTSRVLGEFANTNPPLAARNQYGVKEVRVIPPRQRCSERIEITADRLNRVGATQGQFRVVAYYRNTNPGSLGPLPALTPTVFPNQGVFSGDVQSNDLLVVIN